METTFAKSKVLSFEGSLMKRPQLVQAFEKGSRKKRERERDGCSESWTIKRAKRQRIDAFKLWCGEDSLEFLGQQGDQTDQF